MIIIPTPRKGQTQQEYMKTCVPYLRKEGKSQPQAVAQCISMYKQWKKRQRAKTSKRRPRKR